jgi:8-oxo-dGTP diphosphatase
MRAGTKHGGPRRPWRGLDATLRSGALDLRSLGEAGSLRSTSAAGPLEAAGDGGVHPPRLKVTAGVIRKGPHILLARRAGRDPLAGKWEFPGGKLETGEDGESCLRRELLEEIGITVKVGRFLGAVAHDYPERRVELLFYDAEYVGGKVAPRIHDQVVWISIAELPDYDLAPADVAFAHRLMTGRWNSEVR